MLLIRIMKPDLYEKFIHSDLYAFRMFIDYCSLPFIPKVYNQWLFIVAIWLIADFSLFLLPSYNNTNPFLYNKCAS